ncbi:hypothetical protein BaRGS_00033950 [Batillaria attramentaria]|uniref:LIM zinc-binding domain-containing protein n=1 Tax=Batillaria attramentaria TaxID=370345 RepID=A0ABD0JK17_9CAEN
MVPGPPPKLPIPPMTLSLWKAEMGCLVTKGLSFLCVVLISGCPFPVDKQLGDKIWHKACFKCEVCGMTLNMKNYKGYDKLPYCNAHYPQTKHTAVADTPEARRIAENTKIQSNVNGFAVLVNHPTPSGKSPRQTDNLTSLPGFSVCSSSTGLLHHLTLCSGVGFPWAERGSLQCYTEIGKVGWLPLRFQSHEADESVVWNYKLLHVRPRDLSVNKIVVGAGLGRKRKTVRQYAPLKEQCREKTESSQQVSEDELGMARCRMGADRAERRCVAAKLIHVSPTVALLFLEQA